MLTILFSPRNKTVFFTLTKTFAYNNQNVLNKTRFVVLINSFFWVYKHDIFLKLACLQRNTKGEDATKHFFSYYFKIFVFLSEYQVVILLTLSFSAL